MRSSDDAGQVCLEDAVLDAALAALPWLELVVNERLRNLLGHSMLPLGTSRYCVEQIEPRQLGRLPLVRSIDKAQVIEAVELARSRSIKANNTPLTEKVVTECPT